MYTEKEKNDFIALRAEGLSFDKISKKINIPKKTLIRWNIEMFNEINTLKEAALEELLDSLKVNSAARLKMLAKELLRIDSVNDDEPYESDIDFDLLKWKIKLINEISKIDSGFKVLNEIKQNEAKSDSGISENIDAPDNSEKQAEIDFFANASELDSKYAHSKELRSELSPKCPKKNKKIKDL